MDNLIKLYKKRLNLQVATFTRIDHSDAMVATVYKITQSKVVPLILKICTGTHDYWRELYFLKHFAATLPVPQIIEVVPPEEGIDGAILMECLPGELLKSTDFSKALGFELGKALASIHLNRESGYGCPVETNALTSDPRVYFTNKFEEGLKECSNHLPKTMLDQIRHYYDKHIDLLATVDGPCLIHRDFRPGNVIVQDGKLQGIIDWSSGRASFAEEDFCPIEHGEWGALLASKKSFLSGYASIRRVPDYHPKMPLLRLSRAMGIIGFTVKRGTWNSSNARIYQINRCFLETFF